jgi:nucleotide-binding universal stress UspA family protein
MESTPAARKPILVGVDDSPSSIAALRKATELGAALGVPVQAVTVWHSPVTFDGSFATEIWSPEREAEEILEASVGTAFPDGPPELFSAAIIPGPTAAALIDKSRDAEMLVLGSRGRGGFRGLLLGSVSAACAQHAHCPVLIMHGATSS